MDGIQKIGLAHTILTHKTVDLFRKGNINLFIILKVDQGK